LYLKLDKKLILTIDRIKIPKSKSDTSLPTNIEYINYIGKYFQAISIKHIITKNDEFELTYENGEFRATGKKFNALLRLHYNAPLKRLEATIERLRLEDYNLTLKGILRIYKKDRIYSKVKFHFEGIEGIAKFLLVKDNLSFLISTETFKNENLKRVFSHLQLHPLIKKWSYEKIKAKSYKLLYAKGTIDLKRIDPKRIEAKAVGEDVKVWFQQGIDPVVIDKVTLLYKNDNLHFKLRKPRYHNKDLSGSKVTIYNLTSKGSYIEVDLKTISPLDNDIKKIVASYGINLPLTQKKGSVDAKLTIRVHFKNKKVNLKGEFYTQNALFDLDGIALKAEKLFVKLLDSKVFIKQSRLAIEPFVVAKVNGALDLKTKRGKFLLKEGLVTVAYENTPLLEIPNYNDTLLLDLENKIFTLPKLNFHYFAASKKIEIDHVEDLKKYSPLLQKIDPKNASLTFFLQKKLLVASFKKPDTPFFKNAAVTDFTVKVDLNKRLARINDFATIYLSKPLKISLRNVTIDATKLKSGKTEAQFEAKLANVTLRYKQHELFIRNGYLRSTKNGVFFKAKTERGLVTVKKEKRLTIEAIDLSARALNKFIGKNIFYQGSYNINAKGDEKELRGKLLMQNGYLKDFKLINNFFAFLNTIPALMTLSDPGFDKTGLLVKKGAIDFIYTNNMLIFSNINLRSVSMDIVGNGVIDLATKKIKMRLEIQTLKNVASLIKNIPLAGYILLGKDGTISTAVEVYGNLDDPKFRSLLPSQTIKMPFNIIKRTLELPFKLFE
jgi:hypothetical protein